MNVFSFLFIVDFSRYSDGARLVPPPPPPPLQISSNEEDSTKVLTAKYEEMLKQLKFEQNALLEEIQRLKEISERSENESLDQRKQLKSLEEFYNNQCESLTNEHREYLSKICQVFQSLRGLNESSSDENLHSLEELKCQINSQLNYFSSVEEKLVLSSNDQIEEEEEKVSPSINALTKIFNHFERKFAQFKSNSTGEIDEPMENEMDEEYQSMLNEDSQMKKFHQFLQEIYERMKSICKEKSEFEEKSLLMEEKRLSYARWESQMYDILKWINEEKSARSHLKGLANKMAEELDQIRESTTPLLTIGSTSSSMNNAGTTLGHNTVIQCHFP